LLLEGKNAVIYMRIMPEPWPIMCRAAALAVRKVVVDHAKYLAGLRRDRRGAPRARSILR
jgi:hypothetical protein